VFGARTIMQILRRLVPSYADRALRSNRGSCCPDWATDAYRALLRLGVNALPAVWAGLRHVNPNVRFSTGISEMLSDLIDMLNDSDARVVPNRDGGFRRMRSGSTASRAMQRDVRRCDRLS
jgi:hypothetical protein